MSYSIGHLAAAEGDTVSPDGKYIVGSGKLQGVTTAFNFEKVQTAIRNKDFTGDEDGIPVLKYESIKDAEVAVGLGPLHTQFGPNGEAYTSLFVDSAIAKWKLGTWEVLDKVPMSYSIGHLCSAEGDTVRPGGKDLVGLNKLSHGRHLDDAPRARAIAIGAGAIIGGGLVWGLSHETLQEGATAQWTHTPASPQDPRTEVKSKGAVIGTSLGFRF